MKSLSRVLLLLNSILFTWGKTPDVIIIGAGASGLGAAAKLWNAGFTNIKVLEAENRIGGRIHSVPFGDAFIDLGAEWCVGTENNAAYDLVKGYDILKPTVFSVNMVYSNGDVYDKETYLALVEFAKSIRKDNNGNPKCIKLVSTCLDRELKLWFAEKYKSDPIKFRLTIDSTDWLQSALKSSILAFTFYQHNALNWNGRGFKTVLDVLLQKYPNLTKTSPIENIIHLNKEVSKISWENSDTSNVIVESTDGSIYTADHVIFTASLGVLKASHGKIFEPQLPSEKIAAIDNLGFDDIVKIALHFPESWWTLGEVYEFVWSYEDEKKILSEFKKGPVKNRKSWLTSSLAFLSEESNPKVLFAFFSGDMVPQIETEDDQVLLEGCMYMLRKFLGRKHTVIDADKIIKSRWSTNPHFRGTFTHDISGNKTGTVYSKNLAIPLTRADGHPAVLFAGEATHQLTSSVQGAIESGYREADRIIRLHTNKKV